MSELDAVRERYERRKDPSVAAKYPRFSSFQHFSKAEREFWYSTYLTQNFSEMTGLRMLEVGAGGGGNLLFFRELGFQLENIWANELLPDRVETLKTLLPNHQIVAGDILNFPSGEKFDVVFQSTVFSSILDLQFKKKVADKMWALLKPGGLILWYDFVMNNPTNPDVRGVSWSETRSLFPNAVHSTRKSVTLAPPIGRRVGRLYNFLNFPFLRTHIVASFKK